MSQQTTNQSFDDLARALAEGSISRRRALKLFAGSAIAALIPSRALADDDCVRVCHVPFDRETEECDFARAETRCVSRRERRRHLENHPCDCRGRCANCLTTCLPNGGTCTADAQCCSEICDNGTCATCRSNGASCTSSSECCSAMCFFNNVCSCLGTGSLCNFDAECCSENCSGGTCVSAVVASVA